jgi:uncharacterized protein HemX
VEEGAASGYAFHRSVQGGQPMEDGDRDRVVTRGEVEGLVAQKIKSLHEGIEDIKTRQVTWKVFLGSVAVVVLAIGAVGVTFGEFKNLAQAANDNANMVRAEQSALTHAMYKLMLQRADASKALTREEVEKAFAGLMEKPEPFEPSNNVAEPIPLPPMINGGVGSAVLQR